MMGEDENLNAYFSSAYLERDALLIEARSGKSSYQNYYTIKGFDHRINLDSFWCWPWEDTARATITERIPAIDGKLKSSAREEAEAAVARPEKSAIRKALDWLGFADPADPPMTTFVCRVVAGPGDTVSISEDERLIVNGNAVIETNIFYNTPMYGSFVEYPLTLGEGQYFALADYRNGGADSRFFGAVNADEILGTVITLLRRNNL
jgi:signal peptidase I